SQSHTYLTPGNFAVTVSVSNATNDATQSTFTVTVSPTAVTSISVTGFPSPVTTGVPGTFTVRILDANGFVATRYRGTVHLTSSDGVAGLPANYTFTAADSGVKTFTATLNTTGTQSITVRDTVTATVQGTQSGIQVNSNGPAVITVNSTADNTTADGFL